MKELLFRVADKCMAESIAGVFDRMAWEHVIGCRRFEFDNRVGSGDIKVASGRNDPGLFSEGCELVRPFFGEYRRVVMIVDEDWKGSPKAEKIEARLRDHLVRAGWSHDDVLPLVVCPEVDVWLWSESPHSAAALGWPSWAELRPALEREGWIRPGQAKPDQPKEAADWALRHCGHNARRSAALYRQVASKASIKRCEDTSLERLLNALRTWFPQESA